MRERVKDTKIPTVQSLGFLKMAMLVFLNCNKSKTGKLSETEKKAFRSDMLRLS